jgi:hypothetical protein
MVAGFLLFGALACSIIRPNVCHLDEQPAVSDSLYFGTSKLDGVVTPEEWQEFVAKDVTPRFPQGLTSWQVSGQYLSARGVLQREQSYVLYVVHPDTPKYETAVHEIIERYRTRFQQEAVLRVRVSSCMSL